MSARTPIELSGLATIGEHVEDFEVVISYKIIDLFSGQLYSSPSKAIEELIVNSYDAFASNCYVYVSDLKATDAFISVFDDGDGMDIDGLKELWLIAESRKRDEDRELESIKKGRLPIGKFGIGKLASYIVGKKITHLTKKNDEYLIVTMNYSKLTELEESVRYPLTIRKISRDDSKDIFKSVFADDLPFSGWNNEPTSWTLVIITELKSKAKEIREGRLKWIISTALPLVPDFSCYLNNQVIEPSKVEQPLMRNWIIGKEDVVADKLDYNCVLKDVDGAQQYQMIIPQFGRIWGIFELYHNSIITGKSEEMSRSNGFFVMVRGRLINLKNPLFGLPALSHSTFSRFRAVIYADDLDDFLVVNREDVEQIGHEFLKEYLHRKFNEVRDFYDTEMTKQDRDYPETYEELPPSLTKYPIRHAFETIKNEKIKPFVIQLPEDIDEDTAPEEVIHEVKLEELSPNEPIAKFELSTGTIIANTLHPFRYSFPDDKSYQTWAIAEGLLEVYMIDAGIPIGTATEIMRRRDRLLRVLVRKGPRSIFAVSGMLRETTHQVKEFELACGDAFAILGFDVTRFGGKGEPEGYAVAHLGIGSDGQSRSYSLVFDAKSTTKKRVQTGNLHISAAKRHRKKHSADYSVIIAPHFQDTQGDESAACEEATDNNIQLIRATDLADLLEYSAVKALPLSQLETFFEKRTPEESHQWIRSFKEEKKPIPPIKKLLEKIYELQITDTKDQPHYAAIKVVCKDFLGDQWGVREIKDWLTTFSRIVPTLIIAEEQFVYLDQTPDNILQQIIFVIQRSPDPSLGSEVISAILPDMIDGP